MIQIYNTDLFVGFVRGEGIQCISAVLQEDSNNCNITTFYYSETHRIYPLILPVPQEMIECENIQLILYLPHNKRMVYRHAFNLSNNHIHELGVIEVPQQLLLDSRPYNTSDNQWAYPAVAILILMLVCFYTVSLRLLHNPLRRVVTPKPLPTLRQQPTRAERRRKPMPKTSIVSSDSPQTPQIKIVDNKFLSDLLCDSPL